MACFSSSYKDVNLANYNFYPVELKLNGRNLQILDSYGRFLTAQTE